ncbi:MAG: TonB-dependent receptor plug domain-containing protein [Rhizobium sp.]|nr:TonB-dependent receptor plug domain-containing protein [Rhizobium sp.]
MKNRNLRAPLAALPLAILALSSFASLSAPLRGPEAPLPVTVVAAATRSAIPVTDVVADVSIVDREQIERSGANGLADVLSRVPGITVTRNGGPASTTSVYLRGAETRFTAVFVDGVRVDSQSTGGASWNAIPLAQVERIEVLRGGRQPRSTDRTPWPVWSRSSPARARRGFFSSPMWAWAPTTRAT